jgi:hypothetical protein
MTGWTAGGGAARRPELETLFNIRAATSPIPLSSIDS